MVCLYQGRLGRPCSLMKAVSAWRRARLSLTRSPVAAICRPWARSAAAEKRAAAAWAAEKSSVPDCVSEVYHHVFVVLALESLAFFSCSESFADLFLAAPIYEEIAAA